MTKRPRKKRRAAGGASGDNAGGDAVENNGDSNAVDALAATSSASSSANASNGSSQAAAPPAPPPTAPAPQVRIVDGQIVLDERSLNITADPAVTASSLQRVAEQHGERHITAATFLRRAPSHKWSAVDTELFYDGLRCWGTDFEMIARSFFKEGDGGGRTRHQIKLKFNREERACPVCGCVDVMSVMCCHHAHDTLAITRTV